MSRVLSRRSNSSSSLRDSNVARPAVGFVLAKDQMAGAIPRCDEARFVLAKAGCTIWERIRHRPRVIEQTADLELPADADSAVVRWAGTRCLFRHTGFNRARSTAADARPFNHPCLYATEPPGHGRRSSLPRGISAPPQ